MKYIDTHRLRNKPSQRFPQAPLQLLELTASPSFRDTRHLSQLLPQWCEKSPQVFLQGADTILLTLIHSYRFASIPPLSLAMSSKRSYRNLLIWCYALEEQGQHQAWPLIHERLQQRYPESLAEDWLRHAFTCHHAAELENFAAELLQNFCGFTPEDELIQIAKVHVADRLAQKLRFSLARKLMESLEIRAEAQSEWHAMQSLKASVFAYREGKTPLSSLISTLQSRISNPIEAHTPLLAAIQCALFLSFLGKLHSPRAQLCPAWANRAIQGLGDRVWESRLQAIQKSVSEDFERLAWQLIPERSAISNEENWEGRGLDVSHYWLDHGQDVLRELASRVHARDKLRLVFDHRAFRMSQKTLWEQRCLYQKILIQLNSIRETPTLYEEWTSCQDTLISQVPLAALPILTLTEAAFAYRRGDFEACLTLIRKAAAENSDPNLALVMKLWLQTAVGKATRALSPSLNPFASSLTRLLFAPSLEPLGESVYRISHHYEVNLARHPVLNRLLLALLHQTHQPPRTDWLQTQVWGQATSLQGWKQKISNTLRRFRSEFRWTLYPLIDQNCDLFRLNHEALDILPPLHPLRAERTHEIIRLLQRHSMSSRQLALKTRIPLATVKRVLKALLDAKQLKSEQLGRAVYYSCGSIQPMPAKHES